MITPRSTNLKKSLFHGNNFLGGRQDAFVLRTEACKHLVSSPKNVVTLDFEGIWGVSHSFADELLASLSDMLGEKVSKRVKFVGCDEDLVEFLARVGRMHELHMPVLEKSRCKVEVKPLVAMGQIS